MSTTISLDVIEIARPCPADWDAMSGDHRVRFCGHCRLNVYNLSAMTRDAAERLITEKEGKLCGRFYRRVDGTVVTADCRGGWTLRARKLGKLAALACAAVASGLLAPLGFGREDVRSGSALDSLPPARLIEYVIARLATPTAPPPPIMGKMIMPAGGIQAPPPQPSTQPANCDQ